MRERFLALDVFRGAAVALMILVNNPGTWHHLYPPLAHAQWHGATPTDLVFPFFLFAVGNAMAFTLPELAAGPAAAFWRKWLIRTAAIFGVGLFLNASPFVRWGEAGELVPRELETLRIMGVLQRIALAWAGAALVVWLWGRRGAIIAAALLLLGYWLACEGLARGPDPYSLEGFFGTALDRALIGAAHLYRGEGVPFDPEGLASTLPAIAQVLLGYMAGAAVRASRLDEALVNRLFVAALGALVLAWAWSLAMPVNKKIWTSSYVLLTTGCALALLAWLIRRIELQRRRGAWTTALQAFGMNALLVFAISGFVPRVWALVKGPPVAGGAAPEPWWWTAADPRLGSLFVALLHVVAYGALALWLHRRRLYWRV